MKTLNSKILYKTPYLELRISARKFYFAQRRGINSTAALCFRKTPEQNGIKEVLEEAGYKITKKNIKDCVLATASTQMNEVVFHYLVDLTNQKQVTNKLGDGSYFEAISKNKWVSQKEVENILYDNKELYLSSLSACYGLFLKYKSSK